MSTLLSALTIYTAGLVARVFVAAQDTTTTNLPAFLAVLDARRSDPCPRGLLTGTLHTGHLGSYSSQLTTHPPVSNHISVLDDPMMWGVLPQRYFYPPEHMRHALGSADICFTNALSHRFFTLGQVHEIFRLHKDTRGGLWQPTMDRLPALVTAGAWVHIFPEGRVHQKGDEGMRYFKWGVARVILESEVCPDVVPIFLRGFEGVMPEDRVVRWRPRWGRKLEVVFGDVVGPERWEDLRGRWRGIVEVKGWEGAREAEEAKVLRGETASRVRGLVEEVRRSCGCPEEEEGAADWRTYKKPGMGEKSGRLEDGARVEDT